MTNEISERMAAAKAEYDAWEANVVELLSDASKQIETPVFAGYMTALSGKSAFYIAALETALAVVSSERDAAVAALDIIDGTVRLYIDDFEDVITPTGIVVRVAEHVRDWKQSTRQHDDAAERSPETGGG